MSSFSSDNFRYLFGKNWPATGLAEAISRIDRDALCLEYYELKRCAPKGSDRKECYFSTRHHGKLSKEVNAGNNRFEEHLAIALWKLNECWPRHDGGWFRLLDYQFPLKAKQSDKGIGKVDLLGVTDKGRLMVIELKVKPKNRSDRGDSPMEALIQGIRYAAILEANIKVIASEAENITRARSKNVNIIETSPIIQILAPKSWWCCWLELSGQTRNDAGDWEVEFCNLIADIEKQLGLTVECMALDDVDRTDISYGTDCKTPQIKHNPAINSVRAGNTLSVEKFSSI